MDVPQDGDVFLKHSAARKRFVHTGVVTSVMHTTTRPAEKAWTCLTVEGNTNTDGSANGYAALRRTRVFRAGDMFIRWVALAARVRAA